MRVVVTGASGYLGSCLCRRLLQEGHTVRALVRRSSDLLSLPHTTSSHNFELAFGDVTDLASLLPAFSGFDVLFHAAAVVEPWSPNPSVFFTVNVEGFRNVLQAFRETSSMQKMVYTSSFFALGPTDGYIGDEMQMHHERFFCTEYEKSKLMADKIALKAAADGLAIVILYPGVIYGPGRLTSGNLLANMITERFSWRLPGYVGNGSEKFSFCHVEDVVNGHIAAMERGKIGERYLLGGENASFAHVFDIASTVTGTRRPSFHIPLWAVEIYGWMNVFWARLTGSIPLISYPMVQVMRHQWVYSSDKAKEELNYKPRSLKEGLTDVLVWLKGVGKINY
ncbi:unnamed protein product [Victoria cruziana]